MQYQTLGVPAALAMVALAGALGIGRAVDRPPVNQSATTHKNPASVTAKASDLVSVMTIGKSRGGHTIELWRLGEPQTDALGRGPDGRPALLIVAGIDGRDDFGTHLALDLIDRIPAEHAELLKTHTVYVLPNLNPDNDALFDTGTLPKANFGKAPREGIDADHDRRADEDGAEDLNGDGMITLMRIKNPSIESGLVADMVADDDDPRIMRAPDSEKHEIANYALLIEGIDNDGDGQFNEDGFAGTKGGGIDLNKNFPSLWPEHDPDAGVYQLSEPETKALVDWMLKHDNIVATLTIGSYDTILNTPAKGKHAPDGSEPTGIESGDEDIYKQVKDAFKEITKQTGAPKGNRTGAFDQWAYAHFGVYSFATSAWVRPDLVKTDKDDKDNATSKADENGAGAQAADQEVDEEVKLAQERAELTKQGVPDFVIDFLLASEDERAQIMASFEDLSPEEQAQRMKAMATLPADVQERLRNLISGQPDKSMANDAKDKKKAKQSGGQAKKGDSEDAKWLAYIDDTLDGKGFVDWTPFEHPQLGRVEIGGFVPGVKIQPPEDQWDRIATEQTEFVSKLIEMLPTLEVSVHEVHRAADGLWRITVRGTNPSAMPTRSAIGKKANRITPIVVHLDLDIDSIVAGQRDVRWTAIDGNNDHADATWLVSAPDGSTVSVDIRSSVFGNRTIDIQLNETAPKENEQ